MLTPSTKDSNRKAELKRLKEDRRNNPYKYMTIAERLAARPKDWSSKTGLKEIPGKKMDHVRLIRSIENTLDVRQQTAERIATYMVAAKIDNPHQAYQEMLERGVFDI
ncbi:MAG TPA: hypothetical protein ENJ26_00840 [Rhodobacteraceae bacterium]|nr:hypothetical protein [Paracoccaceae bacterium]